MQKNSIRAYCAHRGNTMRRERQTKNYINIKGDGNDKRLLTSRPQSQLKKKHNTIRKRKSRFFSADTNVQKH